MPFAQNSVNVGPGIVETPLINSAITLANAAITATATPAAVNVGDDYLYGYAMLTIPSTTVTSIHVQIFGSDTNSSITSTGNLIADFGVITTAGVYFLPIQNLVSNAVPGSGPLNETAIYQYEQVLATVVGTGTVDYSVVLFL